MKGENTLLFYFTATGNSLYVAKQLENDPISIPQELRKANRHYGNTAQKMSSAEAG